MNGEPCIVNRQQKIWSFQLVPLKSVSSKEYLARVGLNYFVNIQMNKPYPQHHFIPGKNTKT